ncbi:enoyl-CoA hydratase-related protein [Nocardia spumae]|uniref:enoyl-CoA hydratase-related protein n=1 Tax=Nocardia spumae TaxID=2887190 RepID=UPI001D1487E8|nr:enoyl-CoA hydratase-related protein [Nocardia spumae]
MSPTLGYRDSIAVIDLGDGENRFSPDFLDALDAHLDTAVADAATAVVTTAAGRFYSNGLDLDWLAANGERAPWYVERVHALMARVLTLPLPTVAALPGHAFGAGAMLALAHDQRVMRADRGYFCFPEVDIRVPFTPALAALVQAKLAPGAITAAVLTGRRFGGAEAQRCGLVDATAAAGAHVHTAIELLAPLGAKDQATLGSIKSVFYASAHTALTA